MEEQLMIKKLKECRHKNIQAYQQDLEIEHIEKKIIDLANKLDVIGVEQEILEELKEQIKRLELILFELKCSAIDKQLEIKKTENCVNKLPEPYCMIIKDRYFGGKSIKTIADSLSYSNQRVYQLQKEAIKLLVSMQ